MKSPLTTDLLGAVGRLELRGGGASKLPRKGGDSMVFEFDLLLPRESVLCASAKEEGMEDPELWRSWLGASCVDTVLGVGTVEGIVDGGGSGVVVFGLSADTARESPRAGLSACFGGSGTALGAAAPSLRFGSSNGFTPDPRESTETGDADTSLLACSSFAPASMGETSTGDF